MNQEPVAVSNIPLCIDVDGTLIKSDVLIESFFVLLKRNILFVLFIPFWLLKGKAYLKEQIAERVELDIHLLPYHKAFLDHLREQHRRGRRLILATASHRKFARQIAEHLGLFDEILASDSQTNLSGTKKLECLRTNFGDRGFDYAGNARVDLKIWPHARRAILVDPEAGVHAAAARVTEIERVFSDGNPRLRDYLRALRVHQWLKNLLVFIPLLAAHQVGNSELLLRAVLALVAFSFCTSSVYVLNDLLDLSADRLHPRKRLRPFAAGTLSTKQGVVLIPVLLTVATLIALMLSTEFLTLLITYYVFTLGYSLWFKAKVVVDVIVLAGLYTLRMLAGAAAVSIIPSFWLLAFSMFIFLSLAMIKRYSELLLLKDEGGVIAGRGYTAVDLPILSSLGSASGYLAVLVLALYIHSDDVKRLYTHVEAIWLLCPLLLFWMSRMWLAAGRGKMHDDPIVFAIEDRASQWVALLAIVIVWFAT
jgi:4-hydroxybenzoate polyprenyltransferase